MSVCVQCGHANPDAARFCNACAARLAGSDPDVRKTVTIVRCDLTGSTAMGESLDPEALRRVMSRYFEVMRAVVERHGGMVEKFIGDAVMAVFGIPVLHEDDALRAVQAALGMREALAELNEDLRVEHAVVLQMRTGVMSGEVVAADASSAQAFVVGDAANVAARLETSAAPGEILIGEPTHRLVAAAVDAEPMPPLTVKGKAQPLRAWRLLAVRAGGRLLPRRLDVELVGRQRELADLLAAYEAAVAEGGCEVVTIAGEPGIGKSRLAEELARAVGDRATVLRGRCLPYGEGITYWPLVEVLREAGTTETPSGIARLLEGEPDAERIATLVAAAIGTAEAAPGDEMAWAVRRMFEALARRRPIVLLFDDLHWATPTFLELLETIAYLSRDGPLLLVGLARPEFLQHRPGWPGRRIHLKPLASADAHALLHRLAAARPMAPVDEDRIAATAEGNPLFLEQLAVMAAADGSADAVPPTIQALLAARVDGLGAPERAVLESASVVGQRFWSGAVRALSDDGSAVGRALIDLVRLRFVEPDPSPPFTDEDGFRFVHILVRDAAYDALPKRRRSVLHERLAGWIERKDVEHGSRHDEIVGHHLEQAFRSLEDLGPPGPRADELARRAAHRLTDAGVRALAREDMPAAAHLLGRAVDLLPRQHPARVAALEPLSEALVECGELATAGSVLDEAVYDATATGDRGAAARAALLRHGLRLMTDPEGVVDGIGPLSSAAMRTCHELGDEAGLARAWELRGDASWMLCRFSDSAAALRRAAVHAERAGDRRRAAALSARVLQARAADPTPVLEVLAEAEAMLEQAGDDPVVRAAPAHVVALMEAYRGEAARAQALAAEREAVFARLRRQMALAAAQHLSALVAAIAGDPVTAARKWRQSCDAFIDMGERSYLSTRAAEFAQKALYVLGEDDEAERFADLARKTGSEDDIETQARWRGALAKVLARRGEAAAAERLVHEALELTSRTDFVELQGDVLLDAAQVFRLVSRPADAAAAATRAHEAFEGKGMTALAVQAAAVRDACSAVQR